MGNVILKAFSEIILKCNWGKGLPKIGKWITSTSKDKKVTYSHHNTSLELYKKRKYSSELLPS